MDKHSVLKLDIVSAQSGLFSGEVVGVFAMGMLGELGIKPGHAALLTQLKPGPLRVLLANADPEEKVFYVSGGLLEVQPDHVTVLADFAVRADHLDEAQATAAQQQAQQALRNQKEKKHISEVLATLSETSAQIQTIRRMRQVRKLR